MSDLAEFLLARIGEDETVARAATQGRWTWTDPGEPGYSAILWALNGSQPPRPDGAGWWPPGAPVLEPTYEDSGVDGSDADKAHIARWDPARVLAECDAKRRIVGAVRYLAELPDHLTMPDRPSAEKLEAALLAMAAIYADHPDFREEWKP